MHKLIVTRGTTERVISVNTHQSTHIHRHYLPVEKDVECNFCRKIFVSSCIQTSRKYNSLNCKFLSVSCRHWSPCCIIHFHFGRRYSFLAVSLSEVRDKFNNILAFTSHKPISGSHGDISRHIFSCHMTISTRCDSATFCGQRVN